MEVKNNRLKAKFEKLLPGFYQCFTKGLEFLRGTYTDLEKSQLAPH